jgi:uncharacterized protein
MEIQLDAITAVTSELTLKATPAELDLRLDLATLGTDVVYNLTARRVEDEVFLDGALSFSMNLTCARCLEEFSHSYKMPMRLVIQLVADDSIARDGEGDTEGFVIFPEAQNTYSLDQQVRDLIALEMPMKPLCRSDCRGLCPQCGANINETACDCKPAGPDPRWDGLRKLSNNSQ